MTHVICRRPRLSVIIQMAKYINMITLRILSRRQISIFAFYLLGIGCTTQATNQTISTSAQESSSIDNQGLPGSYAVGKPIEVYRSIDKNCTVSNEEIEQLEVWLAAQFVSGDTLSSITQKMGSRGRLIETTALMGTGIHDARFLTNQGLILRFTIDRFDLLLPDHSIVIKCESINEPEGQLRPIYEIKRGPEGQLIYLPVFVPDGQLCPLGTEAMK